MADVYEQNLASKSTLTTTDYIRVVGSDNVSYKQLVSDVAKKIIENYTGSTLAGSAQSVKSAVDSLNSKIGTVTTLTVSDDLDNLINMGLYYHTTSRPSNIPVAADYGFLVVLGAQVGSQVTTLQLYSSTGGRLYYRRKVGNVSDNWAAWKYVTATNA